MQGRQLVSVVPIDPGTPPLPQIPRPRGLFDQLYFANVSAVEVVQADVELTGPLGSHTAQVTNLKAGEATVVTLNLDTLHFHHASVTMQLSDGSTRHLPPHAIEDPGDWHLGRIHLGLASDPAGANHAPSCVLTSFPDDPAADGIRAKPVPHDAWTSS